MARGSAIRDALRVGDGLLGLVLIGWPGVCVRHYTGFTPTPTHPSALHTRARPYLLSRHLPHAQHTRAPRHPAALASVPYGIALVRVSSHYTNQHLSPALLITKLRLTRQSYII